MLKRICAALLCLFTVCTVGCGKKDEPVKKPDTTTKAPAPVVYKNPLTGVSGMDPNKMNMRPVTIMVNNINIAQPKQTGVNKADIVYETEVEGGITRLMAVFKDVTTVGQIGPVRSARYPYIDLSLGHDAVYAHCGQDPTYAAPHLADIDDVSVETNRFGGKRISNGLAHEHTLYTFGDKLWESITQTFKKTTVQNTDQWANFADEKDKIEFADSACTRVEVPFSNSYHTVFEYDTETGNYTRKFFNETRIDYVTGEKTQVKNVFVLMTTISDYPDGKHRKVALDGGDGYYITNGTYTHIKWTKGSSAAAFSFQKADGSTLTVNPGKSWVCLADSVTSNPVIQ